MAKAAIKPPTKSQILTEMAESTGLAKKDVAAVLDALTAQIQVDNTKALKLRQVRNPATGEMVWAAPKPARRVVKVRPLKALKDMAE